MTPSYLLREMEQILEDPPAREEGDEVFYELTQKQYDRLLELITDCIDEITI